MWEFINCFMWEAITLLILGPSAILFLFKHYDPQIVRDVTIDTFKRQKDNKEHTRFPFGFETSPAIEISNKHDVWLFFFPIVNIFFIFCLVFYMLETKYYYKLNLEDLDKEPGVIF